MHLNDNIMLLDIGAGNTDIGVFEGNTLLYTNTISLGGDNITSDIAYVLNVSREEADKLKKDGYTDEFVGKIIEYIDSYHYLDDTRVAGSYIRGRMGNKSKKELGYSAIMGHL